MDILSWILTLAITAGQLVKVPIGNGSGVTLLDITIIIITLIGLFQIRLRLIKPISFITPALLFSLVAFISLVMTPLPLETYQYLSSFLYIIRFFSYVLLGWLLLSKPLPSLKRNINQILLSSGAGVAVLGLLQFIFLPDLRFLANFGWDPHYFRTVSTFFDPNFTGAFFVLTMLLGLQDFATDKKWRTIFFTIIYLGLLTTFSRSSYAMFLASGLVFSILKRSIKLGFITIILFVVLLAGFRIYSQLVATPRNIDRTQSATFRFNTWQQGLILFQKSPLLGIGFNAYRYGIKEYNLGDTEFLESHGSSSNDSSLLFVASTTGIIGLGTYLYFLWTLFKSSYEEKKFILTAGLAGLIIHSFFANSLFYPPVLAWIVIISTVPKK